MDDISEGVRKPAVSLTSRPNFLNTGLSITSMGACYPGDESLLLPRNHSLSNIIFPGNITFPDNRIKSQDSSCKISQLTQPKLYNLKIIFKKIYIKYSSNICIRTPNSN